MDTFTYLLKPFLIYLCILLLPMKVFDVRQSEIEERNFFVYILFIGYFCFQPEFWLFRLLFNPWPLHLSLLTSPRELRTWETEVIHVKVFHTSQELEAGDQWKCAIKMASHCKQVRCVLIFTWTWHCPQTLCFVSGCPAPLACGCGFTEPETPQPNKLSF